MPRRNKRWGMDRWNPPSSSGRSTIAVIERGDPEDDRHGVPFGFARALAEETKQERDGWDDHMEALV